MHLRKDCPKEYKCYVKDCPNPRHNTLLHGSEFRLPKKSTGSPLSSRNIGPVRRPVSSATFVPSAPPVEAFLSHVVIERRRVLFKIVPVRVSCGEKYFDTFAFLDAGSDTTLLRSDVAKTKLGLSGPPKRVNVKSYDGEVTTVDATEVAFSISAVNGGRVFPVKHAYSIKKLRAASNPPITETQRVS